MHVIQVGLQLIETCLDLCGGNELKPFIENHLTAPLNLKYSSVSLISLVELTGAYSIHAWDSV